MIGHPLRGREGWGAGVKVLRLLVMVLGRQVERHRRALAERRTLGDRGIVRLLLLLLFA